ncbi:hypothetical protein LSH36_454g01021 [Paralvinella palmiformis]|uniref:Uncharacterized protein n=1 Tax=Paralvinella palmiformis TaxID=53620 RepID=A0AAD9JAR4_9ANNE|nr:hypothetical protein LSH36_454g01021 [Paralvinella palmiformis]
MGKDQDLLQAVRNQDKEMLQKMLNKNKASPKGKLMGTTKRLNINVQDSDGMTGLHQAALLGDTEMMKILIDTGAMVDIKDLKGMRPLHYAAWQGKEITTVSLLLKEGSSANEPAQNGTTPLHLACEHGHLSVFGLLKCLASADPNCEVGAPVVAYPIPADVSLLLQHHGDPTLEDNDHKTPLDLACEFGRYQVVELLVRSTLCNHLLTSGLPNDVSNRRFTCLHLAARNGHIDVMRLLLQAGVDINRQTLNGTCLHEAALYGKIEAVRILLEAGIDVNQTNSYDQTALDIVNTFTTTKAGKELKHLLKVPEIHMTLSHMNDMLLLKECFSFTSHHERGDADFESDNV